MSGGEGLTDRVTAEGWLRFQARLADRFAAMAEDDILLVGALCGEEPDDGCAPYIQCCAWGAGMLRLEASSNHVLARLWWLEPAGKATLEGLGYGAPTYGLDEEPDSGSLNYYRDLPRAEADRAAVMAVRALRDVFGVIHPVLLDGDLLDDVQAPVERAAQERRVEPLATFPEGGPDVLNGLVDQALADLFEHPPVRDEDGDVPVPAGSTTVYVHVEADAPVVELFACLVTDVRDHERARFEVNVLNRDVRFVSFRLAGDHIFANLLLPSWPFVPEHLRAMLTLMVEVVQETAVDLARRVDGRTLGAPERAAVHEGPAAEQPDDEAGGRSADEDAMPEPLLVIAQLEAEERGSVTPELAAGIAGHDVGRLVGLIRHEEQQCQAWRRALHEAVQVHAPDRIEAAQAEVSHAERTVELLRRALRVVVQRDADATAGGPDARSGQSGEAASPPRARRAPRPRPRRVPDRTIEEVDPEIWG
jgi:hypothetical protein